MTERNDVDEGNVWPDEELEPPPPWCEECKVEGHAWPTCPRNPDRPAEPMHKARRRWEETSRRYGMDPHLFR